jgi:hypothetical protein
MGLRLLGSLLASYVLLGEGITNVLEGGGAAVIAASTTWFLWQQQRPQAPVAVQGEGGEEDGEGEPRV